MNDIYTHMHALTHRRAASAGCRFCYHAVGDACTDGVNATSPSQQHSRSPVFRTNVQCDNNLGPDGALRLAGALEKLRGLQSFKLVSGITIMALEC